MLYNIPYILTPDLLKALYEMGHSDTIVLADANFPGAQMARAGGAQLLRADGHGIPELLDAILQLMPLDTYVDAPVRMMEKMECDKDLHIPVLSAYKRIVAHHDPRGEDAIGSYGRFSFYEEAKKAFCIVQTGETAVYANLILQKGVITVDPGQKTRYLRY